MNKYFESYSERSRYSKSVMKNMSYFKLFEEYYESDHDDKKELERALKLFGKKKLDECEVYEDKKKSLFYKLSSSSCATNLAKDSMLFLYGPIFDTEYGRNDNFDMVRYVPGDGTKTSVKNQMPFDHIKRDSNIFFEVTSADWKKYIDGKETLQYICMITPKAYCIHNAFMNSELETAMRNEPSNKAGEYLYKNICRNEPWEEIVKDGIVEKVFDENDLHYIDYEKKLTHDARARLISRKLKLD